MFFSSIIKTIIIFILGAIIGSCLYHYHIQKTYSLNIDFNTLLGLQNNSNFLYNISSYWKQFIQYLMEKINL
ncbi:hypothetical protein [Candidatus Phytoplasma prunorum]|uniref:hypothetical protein n=1 Tax=Candidatus Phytoplasma prunorum TaxID=47565 RepID=UPI002FF2A097